MSQSEKRELRQRYSSLKISVQEILDNEIWVDEMQTWNFVMEVNPGNLLQSAMERGDTYGVKLILDYIYHDPNFRDDKQDARKAVHNLLLYTTTDSRPRQNNVLQWILLQTRESHLVSSMFPMLLSIMENLNSFNQGKNSLAKELISHQNTEKTCSLHYVCKWPGPGSIMADSFGKLLGLCGSEFKDILLVKDGLSKYEYPLPMAIAERSISVQHLNNLNVDWKMFDNDAKNNLLDAACEAGDDYLIQMLKIFRGVDKFVLSEHLNQLLSMIRAGRYESLEFMTLNDKYKDHTYNFVTEHHEFIRQTPFNLKMRHTLLQMVPKGERKKIAGQITPQTNPEAKMHAIMIVNKEVDSKSDADKLAMMVGKLGFQVQPHLLSGQWNAENVTQKLRDKISDIKTCCSLLVVCVFSHGNNMNIEDDDGDDVGIRELAQCIQDTMKNLTPKILLIDACQTLQSATGNTVSLPDYIHPSDVYTVISSSPGEYAWGKNFIPKLVEELDKAKTAGGDIDFFSVITSVCDRLDEENVMQAIILTDLTRDEEQDIKEFEEKLREHFFTHTTVSYELGPEGNHSEVYGILNSKRETLEGKSSILLICCLVHDSNREELTDERKPGKIRLAEVKSKTEERIRESKEPPDYILRALDVDKLEAHITPAVVISGSRGDDSTNQRTKFIDHIREGGQSNDDAEFTIFDILKESCIKLEQKDRKMLKDDETEVYSQKAQTSHDLKCEKLFLALQQHDPEEPTDE